MNYLILFLILASGYAIRTAYIKVHLDWDFGVNGYRAYWYLKTGKIIDNPIKTIDPRRLIAHGTLGHNLMWLFIVKICGTSRRKIRRFHSAVYTITACALFFAARSFYGSAVGLVAASLFMLYSAMPYSWSMHECQENFILLPFTFQIWSIGLFLETTHPFYIISAGLFGFVSGLFKQNALFVSAGLFFYLFFWNMHILLLATIAICYCILIVYYLIRGVDIVDIFRTLLLWPSAGFRSYILNQQFDDKGNWIKRKNKRLSLIWKNLLSYIGDHMMLLTLGIISCIHFRGLWLFLFIGVVLGIMAANKYFLYYYLPLLPVLCIAGGHLLLKLHRPELAALGIILNICIMGIPVWLLDPERKAQHIYKHTLLNFNHSEDIARFIKENTTSDDCIVVFGINPEIYFYSERRSATDHSYVDSLVMGQLTPSERAREKKKFAKDIIDKKPKYIVIPEATGGRFLLAETLGYLRSKKYIDGHGVYKYIKMVVNPNG